MKRVRARDDVGDCPAKRRRSSDSISSHTSAIKGAFKNAFFTVKKYFFGGWGGNRNDNQDTSMENEVIYVGESKSAQKAPRRVVDNFDDDIEVLAGPSRGHGGQAQDDEDIKLVKVVHGQGEDEPLVLSTRRRTFEIKTKEGIEREKLRDKPLNIIKKFKEKHPGQTNFVANFSKITKPKNQHKKLFFNTKFDDKPGTPLRRRHRPTVDLDLYYRRDDLEQYSKILHKQQQMGGWTTSTPFIGGSRLGDIGLNSMVMSPFFDRSKGAITKTQLTFSETKELKKNMESKFYKNDGTTSPDPEVIDLVTGTSSSEEGAGSSDEVLFLKDTGTKPKPLERPRARSDDADVIEVLNKYAPRDVSVSASKIMEGEKGKRKRFNRLEADLKLKEVCDDDFLAKLKAKYDVSAREREQRILMESTRKTHAEQRTKLLQETIEKRLQKHLTLTEVAIEEYESDEEEEELPPITDDMREVINRACSSRGATLVDAFNIPISRRDVDTLKGLNWLNDEVINFYMQMICERSQTNDNWPTCYAFNTFFYPKLMNSGHAALKRWTRKIDLFSFDIILIPVHLGMHWCLAVIDLAKKGIFYYDSMLSNNDPCLKALLQYLKDEHQQKKGTPFDTSGFTTENVKEIPQQMNGSDCGMFACKFAEYISRRAQITFTQEDMPYFRQRMIYEIVEKNLLHP